MKQRGLIDEWKIMSRQLGKRKGSTLTVQAWDAQRPQDRRYSGQRYESA